MSNHKNHYVNIEEHWNKQADIFRRLYNSGVEPYIKKIPIEQAFHTKDRNLRCIDEGTPDGTVHLAGSGILLGLEKAQKTLAPAQIDGIYSHAECGAAGIYARDNNLDPTRADEYGIQFAQQLAERLGVTYKGHIGIEDMKRPHGLHIARAAYYDATGKFTPSQTNGLPPGFVISRKYLEPNYAKKEAEIAVSIALGKHGFGEKFTKELPFIIIPIGAPNNPNTSLDKLKAELEQIALKNKGRVIIDGFTAPPSQSMRSSP